MIDDRTVSVEFVDAASGQTFARTDLAATALPASFAVKTTLQLSGESWLVEHADPVTAPEFTATGRLVLTIRRMESMPAEEMLYSLPTICDTLPGTGPATDPDEHLQLHEDDWRQVELLSRKQADQIHTDLDAIQRVYEQHGQRDDEGRLTAFRQIHVRSIAPVAESVSYAKFRSLLPAPQRAYAGVGFQGAAVAVVDSFALKTGALSWYGTVDDDRVSVLALQFNAAGDPVPAAVLGTVLRMFDLVLVDWCRCAAIDADGLTEYLSAIGTM
jgi:hypothetical protein